MSEIIYAFCSPGYLNIPKDVFLPEEKNKQFSYESHKLSWNCSCMHACMRAFLRVSSRALLTDSLGSGLCRVLEKPEDSLPLRSGGHSLVGEVNKQIVVL